MDIKEEIKNSIRLSEIVSQNLSLKRRDKSNYIALCPFHKEKTPSFNVSDDKGFFHCFGCGKNGDIFNYVMEMENISFVDALKKLAEHADFVYKTQILFLKAANDSLVLDLQKTYNYYDLSLHALLIFLKLQQMIYFPFP